MAHMRVVRRVVCGETEERGYDGRNDGYVHGATLNSKREKVDNDIADDIADYLFTNGSGQKAKRLVLELDNGCDGGGWCKKAVVDVIRGMLTKAKR